MTVIEIKIAYDPDTNKWTALTDYVGPEGPEDPNPTACTRNSYKEALTALIETGSVEEHFRIRQAEIDAKGVLNETKQEHEEDKETNPEDGS